MNRIDEYEPTQNGCQTDFEVTYPCYLPMCGTGFHTITSGGDDCLVLLTDEDVLCRFFWNRYPDAGPMRVAVYTMPDRATLLETLREVEETHQAGMHQVSHIAFDVSGQPFVARARIREFIDYLEVQD